MLHTPWTSRLVRRALSPKRQIYLRLRRKPFPNRWPLVMVRGYFRRSKTHDTRRFKPSISARRPRGTGCWKYGEASLTRLMSPLDNQDERYILSSDDQDEWGVIL